MTQGAWKELSGRLTERKLSYVLIQVSICFGKKNGEKEWMLVILKSFQNFHYHLGPFPSLSASFSVNHDRCWKHQFCHEIKLEESCMCLVHLQCIAMWAIKLPSFISWMKGSKPSRFCDFESQCLFFLSVLVDQLKYFRIWGSNVHTG